jgi:hypothetical protein
LRPCSKRRETERGKERQGERQGEREREIGHAWIIAHLQRGVTMLRRRSVVDLI